MINLKLKLDLLGPVDWA